MEGPRIDLLGPLRVTRDGQELEVRGDRLRALLVALALQAGRPVRGPALVDAVWGEQPPAEAGGALQSLVSRLRAALDDPSLVRQVDGGYLLDVPPEAVDVVRFERAARDPARAAEALALWRGPLPGGLPAARLEQLRLTALCTGLRTRSDAGEDVVRELRDLGAAHPLDEDVAGLLMLALSRQGRQAEALQEYERVRGRLADELGADPSSALSARHVEVLRAAPATGRGLPAALTRFVGRADELGQVADRLATARLVTVVGPGGAGKTRLATEAARARPSGRTWLVELAPVSDPDDVPASVLTAVGLREAALLDRRAAPREVLERLVEALAVPGSLLVLDNAEHLLDAVAALCEALLTRCPDLRVLVTSREALALAGESLVPLAPLDVPPTGSTPEQALAHPSVALFADRAAAVRPGFAVDAATVAGVVELVRRLDGLPLALELAAARLRSLPLEDVVRRLDDRFRLLTGGSRTALPRHRTLRAVIAWSWDLLTDDERRLADRASVFAGGLTADSAAAVVGDAEVPELLAALVDKSLLQLADGPRYRVLETLREYGAERLAASGELVAVRLAHARWYADLVARADPELRGRDQLRWLGVLREERENVLAALRCLTDAGQTDAALRLGRDLGWYWFLQGTYAEAAAHLRPALELPAGQDVAARLGAELLAELFEHFAAGLHTAGPPPAAVLRQVGAAELSAFPVLAVFAPTVLFLAGDRDAGAAALERVVASDDPWVAAAARSFRARFAENDGDLDAVRRDLSPALAGFRAVGDRWGLASTLPLAALLRQYDGDLDGAEALLQEASALSRQLGVQDSDDQLFLGLRLADVHMRQGREVEAEQVMAATTAAVQGGSGEAALIVEALHASCRRLAGDLAGAEALLASAQGRLPLRSALLRAPHGVAVVQTTAAWLALARGDVAGAAERLVLAHEAAVASADGPIAAMVGVAAAAAALRGGLPEEAAVLLGAAARLRGAHDPSDLDVRAVRADAGAQLGPGPYAEAYASGWQLDRTAALARVAVAG